MEEEEGEEEEQSERAQASASMPYRCPGKMGAKWDEDKKRIT